MSDEMNKENATKSESGSSSTTSTSSTWSVSGSAPSAPSPSSAPAKPAAPAAAPVTGGNADNGGKGKRNIIIGLVVVIIVGIIIAVIAGGGGFYDSASKDGQAPYKTDDEIQAEIDRSVEDGMLNISIASIIEFKNGTSEGTAYIENVPSNKYVMKVTITLDDNGDVVYESGGIKPDSYIETIQLTKDLDAGTYPATATFTAYEPDSLEEVGQAAAKITLVVNE